MKELTLRETQNRLLEMAIAIADIFEKHNIQYIIAFGTLLGAVRHKGFIPWDDDFDFQVFDDQYKEAIDYLKSELPNDMFLEYFDTEPLYFHAWAHIKDTNTISFCSLFPQDNKYNHKGISIDIYKIKKMKVSDLEEYIKEEYLNYLERRKLKNCISLDEYINRKDSVGRIKIDIKQEDKNKIIYGFATSYKRKYYSYEDLLPLTKIEFENHLFSCPNNPDKILESIYSNYKKMPPIHERHSHYEKVLKV